MTSEQHMAQWLDRKYQASPERAGEKMSYPVHAEFLDGIREALTEMGYTVTSKKTDIPWMQREPGPEKYPVIISIRKGETKPLTPAIT